MNELTSRILEPLSQSELTLQEPADDVRGRSVYDRNGAEFGTVDELLIDAAERRVRFMRVAAGGFLGIGSETFLIPVEAIREITPDEVSVDQTRERMASGPKYDPSLTTDVGTLEEVYAHYGFPAYWAPGYGYPPRASHGR